MAVAASVNSSSLLPKSAAYARMFSMNVTGLTLTVTISKAGGAFGAVDGTVAEVSSGWYKVTLTTTDTNTEGDLAFHATDGGSNILNWCDQVAAPVKLADVVAHGGTLGASTATLALKEMQVANADGTALSLSGASGLSVTADGSNYAVSLGSVGISSAGGTFPGLSISGGASGPAVQLLGPGTTPGPVVLIDATSDWTGLDGGPGIKINCGAGDGIQITSAGTGKRDIKLGKSDGGYGLEDFLNYIASSALGKVSGAGTNTEVFKGLDDSTTRLTFTVDSSGNRTTVAKA